MNTYVSIIKEKASQNKYTKWYVALCEQAINRSNTRKEAKKIFDYVEGHHILPVSLCNNEQQKKDKQNIVFFSAREHFVSHWLLTKMFSEINSQKKMSKAISAFTRNSKLKNQKRKLNSYEYAVVRKHCSIAISGDNNPFKKLSQEKKDLMNKKKSLKTKGIPKTEIHKQKISAAHLKKWENEIHWKTNMPHSYKHSENISKALSGKPKSEVHKEKLSKANLGKKQPKCSCIFCHIEISINNINKHVKKHYGCNN